MAAPSSCGPGSAQHVLGFPWANGLVFGAREHVVAAGSGYLGCFKLSRVSALCSWLVRVPLQDQRRPCPILERAKGPLVAEALVSQSSAHLPDDLPGAGAPHSPEAEGIPHLPDILRQCGKRRHGGENPLPSSGARLGSEEAPQLPCLAEPWGGSIATPPPLFRGCVCECGGIFRCNNTRTQPKGTQRARGAAAVALQGTRVPPSPAVCKLWVRCFCFQVQCCGLAVTGHGLSRAFVVQTNTGQQPPPTGTKATVGGTDSSYSLVPKKRGLCRSPGLCASWTNPSRSLRTR